MYMQCMRTPCVWTKQHGYTYLWIIFILRNSLHYSIRMDGLYCGVLLFETLGSVQKWVSRVIVIWQFFPDLKDMLFNTTWTLSLFYNNVMFVEYPESVAAFIMGTKPKMTLERNGDSFKMAYELVPGKELNYTFKLGEEVDVVDDNKPPMYHNKVCIILYISI